MCGIIGRVDYRDISPNLIEGLRRLEYRGYDSAGIATLDGGKIRVVKRAGTVDRLAEAFRSSPVRGTLGIAHTRWATHGGVNDINAHPHVSCDGKVAVIHNGIIENFAELKSSLRREGHDFVSETDTEVVAHLSEDILREGDDLMQTGLKLAKMLKGQYALVIMNSDNPERLLGMRHNAPLMVGVGRNYSVYASDVLGFIDETKRAVFLEDDTVSVAERNHLEVRSLGGLPRDYKVVDLAEELGSPDKKNFEHFTLKEIHEQPGSILRIMKQDPGKVTLFRKQLEEAKRIFFVAAGSSYHASMLGKIYLSEHMGLYSDVILASEYRSYERWFDEGTVLVAVSQSGETMDVLEAVRAGKEKGCSILGVVNHAPSSLERMSDTVVNLRAGQEVGVAATKSFTSQVALFYSIANKDIDDLEVESISRAVSDSLAQEEAVKSIAREIASSKDIYFLGRGKNFPLALEGALKMKELAYLHAEGIAAGELKHGPLALIEKGTPLILINPDDETHDDTISNGMEVKARGGVLIGVAPDTHGGYDYFIRIPKVLPDHYPLVVAVPLQLLAYHTARLLRANIDKPRNLAKSVTVK
ncbi:MAG: glutamine--fructose-6-phosphate transaminase (isomerizing) [Nitrososphaerota archaeon]|jgi:glucosamine--fructose-6-phosphate aminotransferase (isomerizing)|nr:glutamine--fructose-6-phosphate transaminase (isomerizing) [Nitrososphaerota archaeon]